MKPGQLFTLFTGILLVFLGIAGFIPGFVKQPSISPAELDVYANGYGYLFGMIPTNMFFNALRITLGLAGILSSISLGGVRWYSRGLAISYLLFAVMGLFPYTDTTFGLIPIFGSNVWFHTLFGAIAFYFGFFDSPGLLELSNKPQENMQEFSRTADNR